MAREFYFLKAFMKPICTYWYCVALSKSVCHFVYIYNHDAIKTDSRHHHS